MPKAAKKKREKNQDFKKAKLKLGKGKKPQSNATDTSFKARSIALPSQNPLARALAAGPDGEGSTSLSGPPTTSRGLTIDDVLIQLRHVNAGVRKDSLTYLKEVLLAGINRGIPLGERHGEVAKVVRAIGAIINDEDAAVRKALHGFLTWYLNRLPNSALSPYLALLQLQISSALSHIFPAIRLDACKLVELLLETHPSEIVGKWPLDYSADEQSSTVPNQGGSVVFEGLRLSAGLGEGRGASTQAGFRLTSSAKLIILRTIEKFVACALQPISLATDRISKPTPQHGAEIVLATLDIESGGNQWSVQDWDWAIDWSMDPVKGKERVSNDVASEGSGALYELSKTYSSLHSLLTSTFMEAAPTAFGPSSTSQPDEVSIMLCGVCTDLVSHFAHALLDSPDFTVLAERAELRANFSEFLKRTTAWFPFQVPKPTVSGATDYSSAAFRLSLNSAKLSTLLSSKVTPLSLHVRGGSSKEITWKHRVKSIEASLSSGPTADRRTTSTDEVAYRMAAEWVDQCLQPSKDALSPGISVTEYTDLLPVVWTLLLRSPLEGGKNKHDDGVQYVGESFLGYALRQAASTSKRKLSDIYLIRLVQLHEDKFSTIPFFISPSSASRPLIQNWISSVPRTLWELGSKDQAATETLLHFLLEIGSRGDRGFEQPYSLVNPELFPSISAKLIPYFHLVHPSKGNVDGPWTRLLSASTQKLALDVASVWKTFEKNGRLGAAVNEAVRSIEWARTYWSFR